jgi:hypothetical protein
MLQRSTAATGVPIITSNYTDQSNENVSIDLRPGGNGLSHSRLPH